MDDKKKSTWLDEDDDENEEEEVVEETQPHRPQRYEEPEPKTDFSRTEYEDNYHMDFKEEDSDGFDDDQVFGSKPKNVTYKRKEKGQRYPKVPGYDARPPREEKYGYKGGHRYEGRQDRERGKPREGPRYQIRPYKYEELPAELNIDPKMIIFEWRQIMSFIRNKSGPYKIEMHIMKAAQESFTTQDVKKALSGAEVYSIEMGGKVGEDYSIFMETPENKDLEFIGQMEAWKIKNQYDFEIFIHKRMKRPPGASVPFVREKKGRREENWLPGFKKTKEGEEESKRPTFINTLKKEASTKTEEPMKEEVPLQSKEDPFGGLAPRDESKFKREEEQFKPTRAEPPTVMKREAKEGEKGLTKQEKLEERRETQPRETKKTDEIVAPYRKAPEQVEEKEGNYGEKGEYRQPPPQVMMKKLPIEEIRGMGARDKAISTVQGDANQSVISQRSYQTTMSKTGYGGGYKYYKKNMEKQAYRKVDNRSYYGDEGREYYQKDYRQKGYEKGYDYQPRGEQGEGWQGEGGYRRGRGRGRGGPPPYPGGRGYYKAGPGYQESYGAERGGGAAYRPSFEPRRGYRGRGYNRGGGRGYGGGGGQVYYDSRPQDYGGGRPGYEGQRRDQPMLMKEESSASATSAAGMKVKRLKASEQEEREKGKKSKKDVGFKNRFSELA